MATEDEDADYARTLGVIEALNAVKDQCPSKPVRDCAERALGSIKSEGSSTLKEQVHFVLTMMRGWRGDRAAQVHRSLTAFLKESNGAVGGPGNDG